MCYFGIVQAAASQFLRAVRGRRSQIAFARRLGYRGNPITDWENERRYPTAAEAFRACERVGIDASAAFARFHPAPPPPAHGGPAELCAWLARARGSTPIGELAARCGRSRFAVARWLSGQAQPRLPDFFALVDAITGRVHDLVAELVPIEAVSALLPRHRAATAAKRLAFEEPWTEAVLRVMETVAYRAMPAHQDGFIAAQLGIDRGHAQRCVQQLVEAGILRAEGDRYAVSGALSVDTRADPDAVRQLMEHWSGVALSRFGARRQTDLFAYNVLSVSNADLSRIRELLRSTYREIRSIVAASEPSETAALINLHLVGLADEP
jgi:transcriptional regulator with XRE-family HTH domain